MAVQGTRAYYGTDGTITYVYSTALEALDTEGSGLPYLDVEPETVVAGVSHCVINGAFVAKTDFPEMPIVGNTITNVPTGSHVFWPDGVETLETDGVVGFDFNISGDFTFEFNHPLYFPKKIEVVYNVQP